MKTKMLKFWANINFRWCMAEAYLASQRGEMVMSADYLARASEWERELIVMEIN